MKFEHYTQPIATHRKWLFRVQRSLLFAGIFAGSMLLLGVAGYHFIGELPWVDSILEASMILGGMGPVAPMKNDAIKLFASVYALLSGLVIIGTTGIILGPWLHRMLHHFYQETDPHGTGAHAAKKKSK